MHDNTYSALLDRHNDRNLDLFLELFDKDEYIFIMYENAGFLMDAEHMTQAKSDKTLWELFNMLTYFATHNKVWAPQDIRRSLLMESSMNLLMRKPDIKEYYSIF